MVALINYLTAAVWRPLAISATNLWIPIFSWMQLPLLNHGHLAASINQVSSWIEFVGSSFSIFCEAYSYTLKCLKLVSKCCGTCLANVLMRNFISRDPSIKHVLLLYFSSHFHLFLPTIKWLTWQNSFFLSTLLNKSLKDYTKLKQNQT